MMQPNPRLRLRECLIAVYRNGCGLISICHGNSSEHSCSRGMEFECIEQCPLCTFIKSGHQGLGGRGRAERLRLLLGMMMVGKGLGGG